MPDNAVFEHDQISEETGRNGQNGSKIIIMEPMKKQHGATVSFHSIRYRVEQKTGPVCRRTTVQKEILLDLNGIMRPGLNAILGPTGSGKSSFLDVLAGRKDPAGLSGEVLVNGALQPANFKCLSGYVVQDDIVMGTLTVRENLSFSAALRLSSHVSPREKEARVNHLISELGLNKVADSKVGTQIIRGISGGERKRTSIGMELIIDPSVLFLDEPTTGLDASTAHSVLLLLKRMAGQGRTIIMSIHQPRFSIYRLFDSLTLLANGKQVYHGPAQDALDYFSNIGYACEAHNNPADFFLDVINGSSVTKIQNNGDAECDVSAVSRQSVEDQLMEKYRSCSFARAVRAELDHIIQTKDSSSSSVAAECHSITYSSSFCQQLRWVLWRTFWNLMLNPQTSVAQLAVTTLMAAIVGAIFYGVKDDQSGIQNRFGVLFFITTNQCFSTLSAAELFITERKLFIHEYTSGYYRVSVFFLSKILSDIITQRTIPSVLFSCVVYFMIGLKPTASAFFIFMLTVILVSCTAAAMAMAISADQSVVAVANILMTVSFIFMMIFSGLLVNLKSIMDWLSWLKYLSIPRYGLEALEINEFVGLSFCGNVSESLASPAAHVLMCTGEQHLTFQGIDYSSWGLWQNHVALTVMTLIFLIIAYIKLRFISKFS
ncbi:broad substrate specificity ATP-binding cassette transporter ABCG2d isoform X1 [Danio rerio]|uniref:Broad substrate specificity ATP-binding cassette transporter ABCG2d isoform X1 n=1 Tax=Danio rerio TaxID=7955 RepID=A0A8M3B3I6_DANRE|nr:ATP-binding cassette sub-family G member 2 isoform X1 [Danio rerio]|eukprot:XP_009292498.3 ATP-binding cassette sub-family G member 2 isoform X1 [Danio rerio]